jgi:tetratricopeptide (TPR) repeat protein
MRAIALLLLLTPEAPLLPAFLQDGEGTTARHQSCVAAVADDPATGRRAAERWASEGGGAPALHCLAIADLAAGYPKLAAIRLTETAERSDAGDATARARLLLEAALAWLDAGDPQQAEEAVAAARRRAPDLAEHDFVAAKAFAAGAKWQAAADAVTALERAGSLPAEAHVLRARALRALGRNEEAAQDVAAALNLDPANLDALVLRGELAQAGFAIDAYYGDDE